ncbi:hypothetical protein ACWATR_31905 [Nostoc sp. UIC 10890]
MIRSKVSTNGKRQSLLVKVNCLKLYSDFLFVAPLTMWRRINGKEKLAIATINILSIYTEVLILAIV